MSAALAPAEVAAHLQRLGVHGQPVPSADWLQRLHLDHMIHVPFENLDLHVPVALSLDVADLHDKIVARRRGGYCYELNGLFAALLRAIGFGVTLVQCRVWMGADEAWSAPFDHLALLVEPAQSAEPADHDTPVLVDVGFGDSFRTPRPLGSTWSEPGGRFRTVVADGGWHLERDQGDGWAPQYALDPTPRSLGEFLPRCRWHETSPDSPFRHRAIATRATAAGRVTIAGDQLVVTSGDERSERTLGEGERHAAVAAWFGADVADAVAVVAAAGPAPADT